MSFEEFSVDALALDPAHVHVIQRFNKTVSYFIDGRAHDVVYVDDLAAIAAYDAFIALKNTPDPINVGDFIRLRGEEIPHQAENVSYMVTNVPTPTFPWWALFGTNTNSTYVLALGAGMSIELIPPP